MVVSQSPAPLSRLLSAVCSVKQDLLVNAVTEAVQLQAVKFET